MTYDDFKAIAASVNQQMCELSELLDTLRRYSYEELTLRIPNMTDDGARDSLNTSLGEYEKYVKKLYNKSQTLLAKVEELDKI